jgi:large subunit ribosomal protein L25
MDFVELKANLREEKGKELNKKLRKAGLVPGVVYRKGEAALSLKVDSKSLSKVLHTEAGENVIIKLFVEGDKKKKERIVVIKELQKDPVKDILVHLDLNEISLTVDGKRRGDRRETGRRGAAACHVGSGGGVLAYQYP